MSEPTKFFDYDPKQKKLTVRGADRFLDEVFDYADDVEILDMSFGHLTSLPANFGRFKNLRIVFFSHNDFQEVPVVLSTCERLELVGFKSCKISNLPDHAFPSGIRGVILTDNQLSRLPGSIGEYTSLQKLMLAGNQLQTLPEEILACKKLELFRLPINNFERLPDWLFRLPRLGWYTDASNPFHKNDCVQIQGLKEISWNGIVLGEKLGESAKNTVYRARFKTGVEVAVKIYGKGLTTDGSPIDDMQACLLAGNHQNIIGAIGKLIDTPDNALGLVMPLISGEFMTLGNPPDFKTFTRDIYPHSKSFSPAFITQVLRDIASAMRHCHSKGIMHGDIYAHNILTDVDGKSYLGDFGAASLYKPHSLEGKVREQIDVRGFGCLIEDLLSRCDADQVSLAKLQRVMQACLDTTVSNRPSFAEIHDSLSER